MTRPPDRAQNVELDELEAWSEAVERFQRALSAATSLKSQTSAICTYNYKSAAKAMDSLMSFAGALEKAVLAYRAGKPLTPGSLKPRSLAHKHNTLPSPEEAAAKARDEQGAKKAAKKKPS